MRYDFEIRTDHFQVLLGDAARGATADTSNLWADAGRGSSVARSRALVAIGTARYGGSTRIRVEVERVEPEPEGWSEIGRFPLELSSGELSFWSCEVPDAAFTIRLEPGTYVGRAFSRGTEAVVDEEAEEGPDEYRVVLWRAGDG